MPFQNSQQFGLAFERHFANFVQKQRAAVGLLEEADVIAVGAGERARFVAEQLAFHQLGGNRRAVDAQHRPIGARARFVQRPGDQFLARAAFPAHEHAARRAGQSADFRFQFPHRRAIADQFAKGRTIYRSAADNRFLDCFAAARAPVRLRRYWRAKSRNRNRSDEIGPDRDSRERRPDVTWSLISGTHRASA